MVMRFIREHACKPCTVQDALRVVPVGRRWLEQQFASHLGRTPHDEITRIRIETAQRLLVQPDLTINEVASRCGYAEIKSFYQAFRKVTKTTPAAFRRARIAGPK
jgi:LacI family transcriptional regulator